MPQPRLLFGCVLFVFVVTGSHVWSQSATQSNTVFRVGLAKVDITPSERIRMSGYGNRDHPSEGIQTRLFARAIAIAEQDNPSGSPAILITVDNIGFSAKLSDEVAAAIKARHNIPRNRIAISCTHTHAGPSLNQKLANIFSTPLTESESEVVSRYVTTLRAKVVEAANRAIADLSPAKLSYAQGQATFAANRRVLQDGRWTGFGVQANGPVDHRVPVLKITGQDNQLRGVVFNYACHCTTLGGDYYQINADWAGYATTNIENANEGVIALCTIGCGADANPSPRGTVQLAKAHGDTLAGEVQRVISTDMMQTIDQSLITGFDYAALSFDLPTKEELELRLGESNPQARRHAQQLLKTYQQKGRLPATYPVPIQAWQFGDQLCMVFLGGEVVVDYANRLRSTINANNLWISAYSNDVMGYVASERMRAEGGYEYDRSGIYYGLPGPWASGSEDLLINQVAKLVNHGGRAEALSPDDSAQKIQVSPGYEVQLVASEPLVKDPINLAFDTTGRVWVVEMGGYPETEEDGRIRILEDRDGDGIFDHAITFLDGLSFPTGVLPYKDGALVCAAPQILYARDTNGDGQADHTETLYDNFRLANPQHRVGGFSYGLDHSYHLSAGDNLGELSSHITGKTINASGHDIKIFPDTGNIETTSGRTQYIRSRDDWGHWFGNHNSNPMYHYPIEDADLSRNLNASFGQGTHSLFTPAIAPPVFPRSSAEERFNDLFAANRFTSACSSIVAQSPAFDSSGNPSIFVCEPVHNLVHRSELVVQGPTFKARRSPGEQQSEFLSSTDPWFRPVRVTVGPDGMLWVVDMYRAVIEHPEWIPDSWQASLNVRAGDDCGRIYRIVPKATPNSSKRSITTSRQIPNSIDELIQCLRSPVGPRRDLAQQKLIELASNKRQADSCIEQLKASFDAPNSTSHSKLHSLWILLHLDALPEGFLQSTLADTDPQLRSASIRVLRASIAKSPNTASPYHDALSKLVQDESLDVALQAVLAIGDLKDKDTQANALTLAAQRTDLDDWLVTAIASSANHVSPTVLENVLQSIIQKIVTVSQPRLSLIEQLIEMRSEISEDSATLITQVLAESTLDLKVRFRLADSLINKSQSQRSTISQAIIKLQSQAQSIATDRSRDDNLRCDAIRLLDESKQTRAKLLQLISLHEPSSVQCAAISQLAKNQDPSSLDLLFDQLDSMSLEVRTNFLAQVLQHRKGPTLLLDALESKRISVHDIPLAFQQQLIQSGSRSSKVRASRLLGNPDSAKRKDVVQRYLKEVSQTEKRADQLDVGKQLFNQHCAVCHQPKNDQLAIGPNLASLSDRSAKSIVPAIFDPNRALDPKYQSYLIETQDGRVLTGVIESELADVLNLAQADGTRLQVRRGNIESMKNSGISIMPEGFENLIAPRQIEALIEYIQSL
ncbi:neutral/alkaline non-lysosomal ceramidase N-terminal domain-containing protein [Stieleria sp. JC731]|uniref:neutral/alkaline non-lysosomal ceramidase N-terminal domain-containing protein n=1 Tax=Pirellulaceae TaxID=2691357 RepID=UPI001E43C9CA|nr:neutral/alkaline non-lysosomal ceramidase N-terminal domain-containing protein [Stieleria sp. JC731]MCC9602316.1 neutral/alkaline non-lysosomal ceramidase N-terminal domain-containing protein [Stieleria sp. JC731]